MQKQRTEIWPTKLERLCGCTAHLSMLCVIHESSPIFYERTKHVMLINCYLVRENVDSWGNGYFIRVFGCLLIEIFAKWKVKAQFEILCNIELLCKKQGLHGIYSLA